MRTNKKTFPGAEVVPESTLTPLDLPRVFGRSAPIEVDLGCGDGTYLAALASENPARDFLGVERLPGRVRSACRRIGSRALNNARVVQVEILPAVQQLLAPHSVEVFHLMFPDPWPKRRHHDRRVFNEPFLRAIARALKANGALRVVTDDAEYFAGMQRLLLHSPAKFVLDFEEEFFQLPASTFEKRFRENGAEIHRLILRKVALG